MSILNRDAILAASDLTTVDVDVPEWGGIVRLRVMTGAERDSFSSSLIGPDGQPDPEGYRVKLIARCAIGEDGARLFTDGEVALLQGKSAAALDRLFDAAEKLNAVGNADVDAAEKN